VELTHHTPLIELAEQPDARWALRVSRGLCSCNECEAPIPRDTRYMALLQPSEGGIQFHPTPRLTSKGAPSVVFRLCMDCADGVGVL
jgi:hypothetical protein